MYSVRGQIDYDAAKAEMSGVHYSRAESVEAASIHVITHLIVKMCEIIHDTASPLPLQFTITLRVQDDAPSHPDCEARSKKPYRNFTRKPAKAPEKGTRFTNGKGTD